MFLGWDPWQSCITTEHALILTQEEGPVNKSISQRHAYLAAWDFYFLFSLFRIFFSMYSFFLSDFGCNFEDQWIRHWPSKVLGTPWGGAIPHGADVSTCHFCRSWQGSLEPQSVSLDPLGLIGEASTPPLGGLNSGPLLKSR